MALIKWINEAPGDPDARGYWRSVERRFSIEPEYIGRTTPQQYRVRDYLGAVTIARAFDTVRACKQWAEDRVAEKR